MALGANLAASQQNSCHGQRLQRQLRAVEQQFADARSKFRVSLEPARLAPLGGVMIDAYGLG
jgi:hypothetical protein